MTSENNTLASSRNADRAQSILHYSGTFSELLMLQMSRYLKTYFASQSTLSSNAFSIFVELAQNIASHSYQKDAYTQRGIGTLEISQIEEKILFSATNLATHTAYNTLEKYFQKINTHSKEDLKALKQKIRSTPRNLQKKGGQTGLIQIALKAESIITLEKIDVDANLCLATISTYLHTIPSQGATIY
ncbi:MAG: DUF6272 family protein [Thermonemataceae bacterium]